MNTANLVVIIVAAIVVIAVVVWFFTARNHPEDAATHTDTPPQTTSEELYEGADRPAGPDVDIMDPEMLGGDQRPPTSATPEDDAGH